MTLPHLITVTLERDPLGLWSASVDLFPSRAGGTSTSDSPGGALELIGQALDRHAALDAIESPTSSAIAHDQQAEDVGRVVEVVEEAIGALTTTEVVHHSGIGAQEAAGGAMGSDGRSRTLRALRLAETAGLIVGSTGVTIGQRRAGDYLWRSAASAAAVAKAHARFEDVRGEADR